MTTLINADFEQGIVIYPQDYQWVASPMPNVDRMMLDRIGDEVPGQHPSSATPRLASFQLTYTQEAKSF